MTFARLSAFPVMIAALLGTSAAPAQVAVEVRPLEDRRIVPMLGCEIAPLSPGYGVWVRNLANLPVAVAPGTQIRWTAANGLTGAFTIGSGGLAAGHAVLVGTSGSASSCSAGIV